MQICASSTQNMVCVKLVLHVSILWNYDSCGGMWISLSPLKKQRDSMILISYRIFTFFPTKTRNFVGFFSFIEDGHFSIRLNLKLQSKYITGSCSVGVSQLFLHSFSCTCTPFLTTAPISTSPITSTDNMLLFAPYHESHKEGPKARSFIHGPFLIPCVHITNSLILTV